MNLVCTIPNLSKTTVKDVEFTIKNLKHDVIQLRIWNMMWLFWILYKKIWNAIAAEPSLDMGKKRWTKNCKDFCPVVWHSTEQKSLKYLVHILGETMTS